MFLGFFSNVVWIKQPQNQFDLGSVRRRVSRLLVGVFVLSGIRSTHRASQGFVGSNNSVDQVLAFQEPHNLCGFGRGRSWLSPAGVWILLFCFSSHFLPLIRVSVWLHFVCSFSCFCLSSIRPSSCYSS